MEIGKRNMTPRRLSQQTLGLEMAKSEPAPNLAWPLS
jgi:hypothetical protein